jgi:hypothetical protein
MTAALWRPFVNEDQHLIICIGNFKKGHFMMRLMVREEAEQIINYIIFERRCPNQFREKVSTFCNLLNWKGSFGFFSMDFSDGELRYRHSACIEGITLTSKFIDNFLKEGLGSCTTRYKDLQDLMCGAEVSTVEYQIGVFELLNSYTGPRRAGGAVNPVPPRRPPMPRTKGTVAIRTEPSAKRKAKAKLASSSKEENSTKTPSPPSDSSCCLLV